MERSSGEAAAVLTTLHDDPAYESGPFHRSRVPGWRLDRKRSALPSRVIGQVDRLNIREHLARMEPPSRVHRALPAHEQKRNSAEIVVRGWTKMNPVNEFLIVYLDAIDERLLDYLDEDEELRLDTVKRFALLDDRPP